MARQPNTSKDLAERVQGILKVAIESELERAATAVPSLSEGAPFSRGIIFSKTNPFSRGIFFSRLAGMDPGDRDEGLELEVAMNPEILAALAERLVQVKALKELKGEFRQSGIRSKAIDRLREE
jgi:hypothetical protein